MVPTPQVFAREALVKVLPELLTKVLEREWRLLDPRRVTDTAGSSGPREEEAPRPAIRLKIGRVD